MVLARPGSGTRAARYQLATPRGSRTHSSMASKQAVSGKDKAEVSEDRAFAVLGQVGIQQAQMRGGGQPVQRECLPPSFLECLELRGRRRAQLQRTEVCLFVPDPYGTPRD